MADAIAGLFGRAVVLGGEAVAGGALVAGAAVAGVVGLVYPISVGDATMAAHPLPADVGNVVHAEAEGEKEEKPPGNDHGIHFPQNPDDLLAEGWKEITSSQQAAKGIRIFVDPGTGHTLQHHQGRPGEPGFAGKDHYHWVVPGSKGTRDVYLDKNGKPVPKGSKHSHILPEQEK